jgi:hypothetical protein
MTSNGRWWTALVIGIAAGTLAAAPAHAELRIEKHLALAPGGRLIVKSEVGSVTVRGDAASGAAVVVTSDRDDLEHTYELRFEEIPGGAQIVVERRYHGWLWFGGWQGWRGRVAIAVSVPRATAASVHASGGRVEVSGLEGETDLSSSGGAVIANQLAGKLAARSSGGAVEVRDMRGDVHLSSSGGPVRAFAVRGAVEARSSGGGVEIQDVAGNVHAGSSGGSVSIGGAAGRVEASSSGGSVRVSFSPGNAHGGDIGSSGGAVEVHLDPAVGLNVDASASGGSVYCDLPVTVQGKISHHSLHGVLKGGGELLHLRSSGGGVRIGGL